MVSFQTKYRVAVFAFRWGTYPLVLIPRQTARRLFGWIARKIGRAWTRRFQFAVENIRRSMEAGAIESDLSAEELALRSFANLGHYFVETLRLFHGRDLDLLDRVRVVGEENYQNAIAKNRGIIAITGHCSNWELSALVYSKKLGMVCPVARPQNNPYLNQILEEIRVITGNKVIYKEGAVRQILSLLKQNRSIGILMDQAVLREESVVVDFLGRPALTTKLPAMIARKTGAAVIPLLMHEDEDGGYTMVVDPEIPLCALENKEEAYQVDTQAFTRYIEQFIKKYPTQWLWGHRRWKRAPAVMTPIPQCPPPISGSSVSDPS